MICMEILSNGPQIGTPTICSGPAVDPVGPASGTERVFRGGGYGNSDHYSRSSVRFGRDPETTYAGLRVAT